MDAEMSFLEKFWEAKKMTISEFHSMVNRTLVEAEQISDVVLEYFIEELRIKEKIKTLETEKNETQRRYVEITKKIKELEEMLDENEDDKPVGFGDTDPCSRPVRQSSC